jgi:hypothetical protein
MLNLPTQGISAPSAYDSVIRSSPPYVELIQLGCGLRAYLTRQTIRRPISGPWSISVLLPEVSLRQVTTASSARGWPHASHDCFSSPELASASRDCFCCPDMASGESEQCLPFEGGLERAGTTSPVWSWTRTSHDCFSCLELASRESEQRLPPRDSLGRVGTASPVQGWPQVRRNNLSHLRLASGETEQCLLFCAKLLWHL